MLVILTACAGTPESSGSPPPAAPPAVAPAPASPPPGDVTSAPVSPPTTSKAPPPCPRLAPALWSRVADPEPVQVVVEHAGAELPPGFVVEAESAGAVQGRLPGTSLCDLAGRTGVAYVRAPATPSPKAP